MLHEPDELRTDIEKLLASLQPARSLSRDETLFAAGRARGRAEASGRRPTAWPWQVTTGVLAVALVAVLLARSDTGATHSRDMLASKKSVAPTTPSPHAAEKRSENTLHERPSTLTDRDGGSNGAFLDRQTRSLARLEGAAYPLDRDLRSWLLDGTDLPLSDSIEEGLPEGVDPAWAPAGMPTGGSSSVQSPSWFTRFRNSLGE